MKFPFLLVFLGFVCSCGSISKKSYAPLKLKGSESMHETFDALASDFEQLQDTLKIVIEGGGSRTGLMAIKDQTADIGMSSFSFDLDAELGSDHQVVDRVVAFDGIVIVNNERNPLKSLTNEQISGIYNGEISDWSEIGGEEGTILPISRNSNSGTQRFFEEYFNIEELTSNVKIADENHEIINSVFDNKNSIGFIGYGYFNMLVNEVAIPRRDNASDSIQFVHATTENIGKGLYPLKRSLHIYYKRNNDPRLKAFLTYLNTSRAKQVIEGYGLITQ